jgi:hypothetical protein
MAHDRWFTWNSNVFHCQGLVTVEALKKNMIPSLKYFHDTTLNQTSV